VSFSYIYSCLPLFCLSHYSWCSSSSQTRPSSQRLSSNSLLLSDTAFILCHMYSSHMIFNLHHFSLKISSSPLMTFYFYITHTHTHTHTHIHRHTQTHTQIHTDTYTHIHRHTQTHTDTYTHTYTDTHKHTHKYTHTHTHTPLK